MHIRYFLAASAASLSIACGLAAPAHAQETTSTIRGTVTSSGSPVGGATVEIQNTATGATSTATTSATGAFNVTGLRAGDSYTVNVTASGYSSAQVTDVVTVVAQAYELPIDLASEGQDIVVTATRIKGAGNVSQGPATVLSVADIANTPSINRDIRDLSRRDPFARLDDTPTGGRAVSFAGQNARYNKFSVDGVAITDNFGLNTDGLPSRRSPIPLDAIGQFQAKVAPFDVREGNFQGGAINIVLRSGTNEWQGTAFYSQTGDGLVGKKTKPGPGIASGVAQVPKFKIQNYGAELSGPIIKDKLFFMVAGERLRGGRPIAEGPVDGTGTALAIPNLTQAQVDQITSIAKSKYGYDTGGVLHDLGDKDDRLVAKLDFNASDTQRFALTYTYAKDGINLLNNTFSSIATGSPGLGLASNAYIQGNRLHTGVAQWNSEWSDTFSTEVRGYYKNYVRIQDPVLGRGFAQFRVCTNAADSVVSAINPTVSPTGCERSSASETGTDAVVSFGPDNSRQTNQLTSESWGGLIQGRLTLNDHDVRVFGEYQDTKIFNSFLQNSAGNYYFDSIADFAAGRASSLAYGNAVPSLVPDDAAAKFGYQLYTFGIMDSWRPDPTLNVSFGMRYDLFGGNDLPAFSQVFQNRYVNGAYINGSFRPITTNQAILDGRGLFQPRFGFDWKPTPRLTIRGGGGIFGGGAPDVYLSNSFSNTGVLTNSFSISRANGGTFTGVPGGAACAGVTSSLDGVTGTSLPTAANTCLASVTASTTAPTNALDPKFKIPSQFRATLTGEYDLGNGFLVGADFLYSKVRNQVYFLDIRSAPILTGANALTPDGRQRYFDVTSGTASTLTNTDILLTNTHKGRAYIAVARVEKNFDFGLGLSASYTWQSVKDQAPATSSTAGSNYSNGAFVDPNNVSYGISNDQVKNFFKYSVTFDHAFFGDYKTSLALFGETRSGHPFSYTFQDFGSGRSAVFGVTGRSSATSTAGQRYLMYVPTGVNDPLVQYSSAQYAADLNAFIDSSGLSKYRGSIAPRNAFNSKWFTRLDLHVSQEIPMPGWSKARFSVFADVENFTNLINKKWGQQREYVFPYNVAVTQVQCLTTAGNATPAAGGVATGTVATNVGQNCAQYRYSPVNNAASFQTPTDQVYVNQSLYSIRVGVKFSF